VNCSWAEERFERLLDGELTPRDRAALVSHVDRCRECRVVLEELRVVDALLMTPREVTLAPNFTFATMAEVRALPPPAGRRSRLLAYIVSYLTAAWLIAGAAYLLEPGAVHAAAATVLMLARSVAGAFGGLGHAFAQLIGRTGNAPAVIAGVVVLDLLFTLGVVGAIGFVRPRLAERLRS
jgi:anti-sigma factor RsiW